MQYSKEELIKQHDAGQKLKFLHFWGHKPHPSGEITSSKFRVALIAIDTTEIDFGFYLMNPNAERFLDSLKLQKDRYIWSNEIQLDRLKANEPMGFGKWELKKKE